MSRFLTSTFVEDKKTYSRQILLKNEQNLTGLLFTFQRAISYYLAGSGHVGVANATRKITSCFNQQAPGLLKCGPEEIRTLDLSYAKAALYQLSYRPENPLIQSI